MAIDLEQLLDRAFYRTEAMRGTQALEEAHERYIATTGCDGIHFEAVVPNAPELEWFEDLLRRLVYLCDSEGFALPRCAGAFVALFVQEQVCFVMAPDVVGFASALLGIPLEELEVRYGTGESHTGVPRD